MTELDLCSRQRTSLGGNARSITLCGQMYFIARTAITKIPILPCPTLAKIRNIQKVLVVRDAVRRSPNLSLYGHLRGNLIQLLVNLSTEFDRASCFAVTRTPPGSDVISTQRDSI